MSEGRGGGIVTPKSEMGALVRGLALATVLLLLSVSALPLFLVGRAAGW